MKGTLSIYYYMEWCGMSMRAISSSITLAKGSLSTLNFLCLGEKCTACHVNTWPAPEVSLMVEHFLTVILETSINFLKIFFVN